MDFNLSEDQTLLRDALERFLTREYGFEARRAASRSADGWRRDIWAVLSNLGLLGVGLPERVGGLGGGAVEQMIVLEEFGRALVLEPYLETVIIGAGALARTSTRRADELLAAVAAGRCVLAFAWAEPGMRFSPRDAAATARREGAGWRLDGRKAMVTAAPWADLLVVLARTGGAPGEDRGLALFLVEADAPGVTLHPYPTFDGRRAADVVLAGVSVPADAQLGSDDDLPFVEELIDRATAALTAEAVGVTNRLYRDTVEYAAQRRQFGQPLSGFQVLQHRMVDMFVQTELARSACYLATLKLDADPVERAMAVSAAKVSTAKACRFVGENAVQLHGGMGMTDDLAVGHFFKRALMIESEFGDIDHHLARYAALSRNVTEPVS
jgi:alkylation response protein AidB-like acyl-CoA dehydrogenase